MGTVLPPASSAYTFESGAIGLVLERDRGGGQDLLVTRLSDGGPAMRLGVRIGCRLVRVGDISVEQLTEEAVRGLAQRRPLTMHFLPPYIDF